MNRFMTPYMPIQTTSMKKIADGQPHRSIVSYISASQFSPVMTCDAAGCEGADSGDADSGAGIDVSGKARQGLAAYLKDRHAGAVAESASKEAREVRTRPLSAQDVGIGPEEADAAERKNVAEEADHKQQRQHRHHRPVRQAGRSHHGSVSSDR